MFNKLIVLTLTMLLSFSLHGSGTKAVPSRDTHLPSLDWQKFALEQSISKKVKESLATIIKSNEYVVDIEINVSPPSKPKFTQPEPPGGGGAGDEKGNVKPTDVKPDQLPRDYIVFSKLGLEAPLVDDYTGGGDKEKGGEKSKAGDELPSFEQLWKFNKALDIFNNLESVKIYVQLSEKLHTETRDAVKKVLNSLKFNLNEIVPELEITYIDMEEKYNSMQLPGSFHEFVDFVSRFSNMIGLIMATILLGAIAFVLFNKWAEVMRETSEAEQAAAAAAQETPQDDDEEDDKAQAGGMGGGPFDQDNTDGDTGVERFVSFLEHSEVEAVMLVKKWINSAEKIEINALRALVQQLKNDMLMKIFKMLTPNEREEWKGHLNKQVVGQDLVDANAFISNQIVEDILVPAAIVDADVADLLLRLTPENGARFIQDHDELGKVLLNVMNTKFVAKILENLEESMVDSVLARGMEFKKEDVDPLLDQFKTKLKDYQVSTKKVPFLEKILDLIPVAMPSRENSLFKVLATNSENMDEVKGIAMKYYPSVLVPQLPDQFLKATLQAYPMGPKVELIASVDEVIKDKFVNIFAPAGSKAADVLDLELEKIETDLAIQKKIRNEKDAIWKHFVDFARKRIKADKQNAQDFESIAGQWIERVANGSSPEDAAVGLDSNTEEVAEAA